MEITERLKAIINQETNIDLNIRTRKREVVEVKSMYYSIIKELNASKTLQQIADTVNLDHATVLYSLRQYNTYERFNSSLKPLRQRIINMLNNEKIVESDNCDTLRYELQKALAENSILKIELENNNSKLAKVLEKARYENKTIENLNNLMTKYEGTEQQQLITDRLDAFYKMNNNIRL